MPSDDTSPHSPPLIVSVTLAAIALLLGGWRPTQLIGAAVLVAVWVWAIASRVRAVDGGEANG